MFNQSGDTATYPDICHFDQICSIRLSSLHPDNIVGAPKNKAIIAALEVSASSLLFHAAGGMVGACLPLSKGVGWVGLIAEPEEKS